MLPQYPAQLPIVPLTKPVNAVVRLPGSKSITNRALILAALYGAPEGCLLAGALHSEDTQVMCESWRRLGLQVDEDVSACTIRVRRIESAVIPAGSAELFVGNSGTTVRFLAAAVALGTGQYRLDGVPRMRERPIEDLLEALRQLGVRAESEHRTGCPPVLIESKGLRGGRVRIKGDISSQFLTGLLMAVPRASADTVVEVMGTLVSWPYVSMTLEMLKQWGLRIDVALPEFRIPGNQTGHCTHYAIEPDASAASYFAGLAAIAGGSVHLEGVTRASLQGDVRFLDLLREMGCEVSFGESGVRVVGGNLRGIDVDMNDISDTVMTLAAVACFAEGPTTIRNVAHIRHKETDRIAATATELTRLGASVEELANGLRIHPGRLHGGVCETYNDHRMAMSLTLIGLRIPGVIIDNPGCVAKTYPGFFEDVEKLRSIPE